MIHTDTMHPSPLTMLDLVQCYQQSGLKNILKGNKLPLMSTSGTSMSLWRDTSFFRIADSSDDSLIDAAGRHRDIFVVNL